MHEDHLRALIREAIHRHLGPAASPAAPYGQPNPPAWKQHPAHGRFVFLAPTEPDAPCVVEPQVRCHHCGFCQTYGH